MHIGQEQQRAQMVKTTALYARAGGIAPRWHNEGHRARSARAVVGGGGADGVGGGASHRATMRCAVWAQDASLDVGIGEYQRRYTAQESHPWPMCYRLGLAASR